jgi:hypothetical protein
LTHLINRPAQFGIIKGRLLAKSIGKRRSSVAGRLVQVRDDQP